MAAEGEEDAAGEVDAEGGLAARVQRLFQTVLTAQVEDTPFPRIGSAVAPPTIRWRPAVPAEVVTYLMQRGAGADTDSVRALVEDLHAGRPRPVPDAVRNGIAAYFRVPESYFTDDAQAEAIDSALLVTAFAQLGVAGMRLCRGRTRSTASTNTMLVCVLESAVRVQ